MTCIYIGIINNILAYTCRCFEWNGRNLKKIYLRRRDQSAFKKLLCCCYCDRFIRRPCHPGYACGHSAGGGTDDTIRRAEEKKMIDKKRVPHCGTLLAKNRTVKIN